MNKNAVLCLRDGDVPSCRKNECYKHGGECRRTTDVDHAITAEESRRFSPDEAGNLWKTTSNHRRLFFSFPHNYNTADIQSQSNTHGTVARIWC